jgi:hypothetical protein
MAEDEPKDAPKPVAKPGAKTPEIPDELKERVIRMAKQQIAGQMLPALKDPRNLMRTMVAIKVLGIVEREIGKGEGPLPGEWAKLKDLVAKSPEAVDMVGKLEDAMGTYAADLDRKIKAGEVDETQARESALKVIRMTLLKKIQIGRSGVAPDGTAEK